MEEEEKEPGNAVSTVTWKPNIPYGVKADFLMLLSSELAYPMFGLGFCMQESSMGTLLPC